MKIARFVNGKLWLSFEYNHGTIEKVRTISGRRYHTGNKNWSVPLGLETIDKLKKWGFKFDRELRTWCSQNGNGKVVNTNQLRLKLKKTGIPFYPFQVDGIVYLESKDGRALLADEMGLGKTIQALGWINLHPELRPVIIIVPASLKLNWKAEIQKWGIQSVVSLLKGRKPYQLPREQTILIINYDIIESWLDTLKKLNPKLVIMDECHYIKNSKTKRTKAIKKLCKGIPHIIALSGTPIVNRPIEFYNIIKIIKPELFPTYWDFVMKYCAPRNNGFGWDVSGASNTKELHKILTDNIMLRRLKKDVLKELPTKTRSIVPLESDKAIYNSELSNFTEWLKQNKGNPAIAMVKMEKLKQTAVKGKMNSAISWIKDFLEEEQKLVVFVTHHETTDRLKKEFGKECVVIDGRTPTSKRQDMVNEFQNNKRIGLLIGNIKAAGVGLTLHAASSTAFVELGWTPGEHLQAEDRVHRIGQIAEHVTAYYLIAADTIEEQIAEILDKKAQILSMALDGKEIKEGELITELLDEIKEG